MSKNTNCLKGIKCPKCKQADAFRICGTSMFEVTDDGTEGHSDVEWSDSSPIRCPECGHIGTVGEFSRRKPKKAKLKKWMCWSNLDPNNSFKVDAESSHDAALVALAELGYSISAKPIEEEGG